MNPPLAAAPVEFEQRVHKALKSWYDSHPKEGLLDDLIVAHRAEPVLALTRRQRTNLVLEQAIAQLAHHNPRDAELLKLRFCFHLPVEEARRQLNYAESTIYSKQNQAIGRLAAILYGLEMTAWHERAAQLAGRLESMPPRLVGVDGQIGRLAELLKGAQGPWLLSIMTILAIGLLGRGAVVPAALTQFQTAVTYLIGASLILTGVLQLSLSRYAADRIFERKHALVLPNLLGALLLTSLAACAIGALITLLAFPPATIAPVTAIGALRALLVACFVTLCDTWLVVIVLSSLKRYGQILAAFAAGYGLTLAAALLLRGLGLCGLLLGFLLGQALLLFALLGLVLRAFPAPSLCSLDFLRRGRIYPSLVATGFLYNLAIWADKILFWYNPATSEPVLGPLRGSLIYDLPIFLAYLSIIPGMGVFLVRVETDFAEQYEAFYHAVREGDTLAHIEARKDLMVEAVQRGLYEIFKVQGLTVIVLLLLGESLLAALGISPLYARLFYVDLCGAAVQVLLLAILNVFFYLDQRLIVLFLSALFLALNVALTLLTQRLGPIFYGYGFAVSVTLTSLLGLALLSRKLDRLEYETFMLQPFG